LGATWPSFLSSAGPFLLIDKVVPLPFSWRPPFSRLMKVFLFSGAKTVDGSSSFSLPRPGDFLLQDSPSRPLKSCCLSLSRREVKAAGCPATLSFISHSHGAHASSQALVEAECHPHFLDAAFPQPAKTSWPPPPPPAGDPPWKARWERCLPGGRPTFPLRLFSLHEHA